MQSSLGGRDLRARGVFSLYAVFTVSMQVNWRRSTTDFRPHETGAFIARMCIRRVSLLASRPILPTVYNDEVTTFLPLPRCISDHHERSCVELYLRLEMWTSSKRGMIGVAYNTRVDI